MNNQFEGSNKEPDFLDTSSENVTEEQILEYLARIIVDIYLEQEESSEE